MSTRLCRIGLEQAKKVPVDRCQGRLVDPKDQYQQYAYWHGSNFPTGWYAKPQAGLVYITCLEQIASTFLLDETEADNFSL